MNNFNLEEILNDIYGEINFSKITHHTPKSYVEFKGGVTTTSACKLFYITKVEDLFSIQEINGKANFFHRGDYTPSYVNAVLTKMRKPLMRRFLNTLKELPIDATPLFSMSVIPFHKLSIPMRDHYLSEFKLYRLHNQIVFV